MKLKIFLSALLIMGSNNCLGMEKLMSNTYWLCNIPLQAEYASAYAGYYKSKEKSFFNYAVSNNFSLVVKDMLSKYDELQETTGKACEQLYSRIQLCWPMLSGIIVKQDCSKTDQLVLDTFKADLCKLKGTSSWTGFKNLPDEAMTQAQKLFTQMVEQGKLESVKRMLNLGLVTIDQCENEWAGNEGAYLHFTALKRGHAAIANYFFEKALGEKIADKKDPNFPFVMVTRDLIRLKNGQAFLLDDVKEFTMSNKMLYDFIVGAIQTNHPVFASAWIKKIVEQNKWNPSEYPMCYAASNEGYELLERYGVPSDAIHATISEKTIFKEKLKTLTFLAQFSKKMFFNYIYTGDENEALGTIINHNNMQCALALGWAFNCGALKLNFSGIIASPTVSEEKLNQLVIDKAEEIGLPDLKTVDDVQKHRALMLEFRKEELDAIRGKAIEYNNYPIDWEGEFAKFLNKKAHATADANRVAAIAPANSDYAQIDYLNALKRGSKS